MRWKMGESIGRTDGCDGWGGGLDESTSLLEDNYPGVDWKGKIYWRRRKMKKEIWFGWIKFLSHKVLLIVLL